MEKEETNIITLDLNQLKLVEEGDAGEIIFSQSGEAILVHFLELKKRFEQAEEEIKNILKTVMVNADNKLKIEGERVKVLRQYFGARYEVVDPQMAVDLGMATKKVTVSPDSKAIDQYVKDTGELPESIKLRDRTESVVIKEVSNDD